jgi:hypothetical protein
MHSYFLSQLTTVVYLPIFGAVVLWTIRFTDFITPDQYAFPKKKFAVMGLLDRYQCLPRVPPLPFCLLIVLLCLICHCLSVRAYVSST